MSESIPRISPPSAFRDEATNLTLSAPAPQPPAEWQAGALYVNEQLQILRNQVADRLQVLLEALDQDLFDTLQSAAHEAAALHTALVKTSHFDGPVDEVPPDLRRARVRDYRRDTMARVIAPLRHQLDELDLGAMLETHWQAFWGDLAALPPDLPVSITRPEPETLYAPSPEDGLLVTLRKRLVLARRHVQPGTPPTVRGPSYAQEVPLRRLAAYHLRARLPHRLHEHEQATYQRLARAVAAFERAVTTWTHRLLDAERHLDRPAPQLSEQTELSFPNTSETARPTSPLAAADIWAAVDAETKALDKQLRALSALHFTEQSDEITVAVETAWTALKSDTDQADSFLLQRKDRTIPATTPQNGEAGAPWTTWHRQALNRLAFCEALAALHDAAYEHEEALLHALIDTGAESLADCATDAARALRALQEEAAALFDEELPLEARTARLRTLHDRATQAAEARFAAALQKARVWEHVSEALDEHLAQRARLFDLDPASFQLHALAPPEAEAVAPDTATGDVNLQAIAQNHFDSFFVDALRNALQPLRKQLKKVVSEAEDIAERLRTHLGAALDELEGAAPEETEAVAAAHTLTSNGLSRSADAIEAQTRHTLATFPPLAAAVNRAFTTALTDLHDRARTESRIREHLLDPRAIAVHDTRETAPEQPAHRPHVTPTRLHPGLHHEHDGEQTRPGLPLVYQRLFAFRPVHDPDLLVGRHDELAYIEHHLGQGPRGVRPPLMMTGLPGSGCTSFLNVVQKTLLRDAIVHRITLDERIRSESAFAERMARALDVSLSKRSGEPLTLDQIRTHLQAHPHEGAPRVCIVEHFEHLFLRAIRGADLADRVLTFMARTDAQITWFTTASEHGWQLLNRMAPTASQRVRRHRLCPIDRSTLEALIMTRHRRSGLPLVFEPPEEPDPQLHRRLRRARTMDAEQSVLKAAYFDRLHAQCGSNIMLAFFYWTRSAHFDADALVLRARLPQPLDFAFGERFSLPSAFLLRAFLRHTTLTAEEYSEIAQVPLDTSRTRFELLDDATLLQPADAPSAYPPSAPVEPGRRYRLHPLVIHPVTEYLREQHLLRTDPARGKMEMGE